MTAQTAQHQLPGELLIWVLIFSELLVFGVGLLAFMGVRFADPSGFAEAQSHLNQTAAAINTIVLFSSGYFAAKALAHRRQNAVTRMRLMLVLSALLGVVFLVVKGVEFAEKTSAGINYESHPFFTFYFLLTGFHAAHVVAGIVVLLLVAWKSAFGHVEAGTQIWHMIDLIWVLLFPVIYLIGA